MLSKGDKRTKRKMNEKKKKNRKKIRKEKIMNFGLAQDIRGKNP